MTPLTIAVRHEFDGVDRFDVVLLFHANLSKKFSAGRVETLNSMVSSISSTEQLSILIQGDRMNDVPLVWWRKSLG